MHEVSFHDLSAAREGVLAGRVEMPLDQLQDAPLDFAGATIGHVHLQD